jgi:GT2 family glycosyltransferase
VIILYHINDKIVDSNCADLGAKISNYKSTIVAFVFEIANSYPNELLVWCHISLKESIDVAAIEKLVHHNKIMISYNTSNSNFLDERIGYIEDSPFIKVNKSVKFPTWQMSSNVGAVHASVLNAISDQINFEDSFDYFLNSIAKRAMPLGIMCYSEPQLLKEKGINISKTKSSLNQIFKFTKQHYKTRWIFLLFFNLVLNEKKVPIIPLLFSFFYKKRILNSTVLDSISVKSSKELVKEGTIDVIIPTIGRKKYLLDILIDLKNQTHLPANVIIIEQNPLESSISELDFLTNQVWPFYIKHTFIHQAGACNARNIALNQIESEWVFFADDDIRINNDFINKTLKKINVLGTEAVSIHCSKEGERQVYNTVFQWASFGSGCSFVLSKSIKSCTFFKGYEFGFGEDSDFGMQLRNQGTDIVYLPEPKIIHLKAPIGGFRTKPVLKWHDDLIQPKPSPTVLLYLLLHYTKQQVLGYRTTLFFKYYNHQKIKNPISYSVSFKKQWNRSIYWANELRKI